jgi:hypothetical protein
LSPENPRTEGNWRFADVRSWTHENGMWFQALMENQDTGARKIDNWYNHLPRDHGESNRLWPAKLEVKVINGGRTLLFDVWLGKKRKGKDELADVFHARPYKLQVRNRY